MKDIQAIEDKVCELKDLKCSNSYNLWLYFDYTSMTFLFIICILLSKSLEGVWILVGIWVGLMLTIHFILYIIYRFKRAKVKSCDETIDAFCKFLLEQNIYLKPLIAKYIVIEKEKSVKKSNSHNKTFTMTLSITTIFLSVMAAFTVNRFPKTNSGTGIFFLVLVFWLYAILLMPTIGIIWERIFASTDKLQDETIKLLEDVEIRMIKEELVRTEKQLIEKDTKVVVAETKLKHSQLSYQLYSKK